MHYHILQAAIKLHVYVVRSLAGCSWLMVSILLLQDVRCKALRLMSHNFLAEVREVTSLPYLSHMHALATHGHRCDQT